MDFYSLKKKANKDIDDMLRERVPEVKIQYVIMQRYGFGKGFVEKRMQLLEELQEETDKEEIKKKAKQEADQFFDEIKPGQQEEGEDDDQ
jgi:hypothetical protein